MQLNVFQLITTIPGLSYFTAEQQECLAQLVSNYQFCGIIYAGQSNCDMSLYRAWLRKSRSLKDGQRLLMIQQKDEAIKAEIGAYLSLNKTLLDKKFWQQHKVNKALKNYIDEFGYYSHEALSTAAFEHLSKLESWLHEAYRDLALLTGPVRKTYSHYLRTSLKILQQEKGKLAQAMYNRLEVAAKSNDLQGDVIHKVASTLGITCPQPRAALSLDTIKAYVTYIQQTGNPVMKKAINKLRWSHGEQVFLVRKNSILQIPASLSPYIPAHRGYWFKVSQRKRYELVEDLQPLVTACQAPILEQDIFDSNCQSPALQNLEKLQIELDSKIVQLESKKPMSWLLKLFQSKLTKAFITTQSYLHSEQRSVAEKQLTIVESLCKKLEELQESQLICSQIYFTTAKRQTINKLLDNLLGVIKKLPQNDSLVEKWNCLKNKFNLYQPLEQQCKQLLTAVCNQEAPTGGKLNTLYRFHHHLQNISEETPIWYQQLRKEAILLTLSRLKLSLQEHQQLAKQGNRVAVNCLLRDALIIQKLSTSIEKAAFHSEIYNYLTSYLQQAQAASNESFEALGLQESLLLTLLGPQLYHQNAIYKSLFELQMLRLEGDIGRYQQRAQEIIVAIRSGSTMQLTQDITHKTNKSQDNFSICNLTKTI